MTFQSTQRLNTAATPCAGSVFRRGRLVSINARASRPLQQSLGQRLCGRDQRVSINAGPCGHCNSPPSRSGPCTARSFNQRSGSAPLQPDYFGKNVEGVDPFQSTQRPFRAAAAMMSVANQPVDQYGFQSTQRLVSAATEGCPRHGRDLSRVSINADASQALQLPFCISFVLSASLAVLRAPLIFLSVH